MAIITRFNLYLGVASSWSYGIVFVLTIYEVFARYVLNAPTVWSLELSLIVVAFGYTIGGIVPTATRGHLRIDGLYQRFSPQVRRVCDVIAALITIGFLLAVVWAGSAQAWSAIEWGERSGSAWNSMLPVVQKTLIPIAAALMLLQECIFLIRPEDATMSSVDGERQ